MKLQVKKWGDSLVLVLPTQFIQYHNLHVDDWLDLSDAVKDPKGIFMGDEE